MAQIPDEDTTINILSRLPLKILSRFSCVSKGWCKLFKTPYFIKQHLKLAIEDNNNALMIVGRDGSGFSKLFSFDIDSLISNENTPCKSPAEFNTCGSLLWGCCNGLVCILLRAFQSEYGRLCIYNPTTTKYKKLPDPTGKKFNYLSLSGYGFGYDSKVEDYKLVLMRNVSGGSGVMVYALGTNSWRELKNFTPSRPVCGKHGVLANETIHWLALPWSTERINYRWVILSFDLCNETFQQVQPPKPVDARYSEVRLCGFEGSLCLIVNKDNVYLDIWGKKDYGVTDSWTKLFTVSSQPKVDGSLSFVQPLKSFENGEILMLQNDYSLVIYDPERKSSRIIKVSGISKVWGGEIYVKSLVSVTSPCEIYTEDGISEATTTLKRKRDADTIQPRQGDTVNSMKFRIRTHY